VKEIQCLARTHTRDTVQFPEQYAGHFPPATGIEQRPESIAIAAAAGFMIDEFDNLVAHLFSVRNQITTLVLDSLGPIVL
jgi:hypothetical protein